MDHISSIMDACRALADRYGVKWHSNITPLIRLTLPDGRVFCPLTAACLEKTGKSLSTGRHLYAAGLIGVPRDVADDIASAADEIISNDTRAALRGALLTLCKKAPPEPPTTPTP